MANKINNVHVDSVNHDKTRYAIGWDDGEFRYHVWSNSFPDPIIYKNPMRSDLKTTDPGYFQTRRLDGTNKANREIMAHVQDRVTADGLIEKAFADHDAKEAAKKAESDERGRVFYLARDVVKRLMGNDADDVATHHITRDEARALVTWLEHHGLLDD